MITSINEHKVKIAEKEGKIPPTGNEYSVKISNKDDLMTIKASGYVAIGNGDIGIQFYDTNIHDMNEFTDFFANVEAVELIRNAET
jgi:hypothetical protein